MIDTTDATLNVNIDALNYSFLDDLKKQLGPVELEIHIRKRPENWLTEANFWEIIDSFDWSQPDNDQAVLKPAVDKLATMPIANIHQFQDILSEKLWLLDTKHHAQVFIDEHPKGRLSVDDFLYVWCAVVAEGQQYFADVLQHPEKMPREIVFEALLFLASEAYEVKT